MPPNDAKRHRVAVLLSGGRSLVLRVPVSTPEHLAVLLSGGRRWHARGGRAQPVRRRERFFHRTGGEPVSLAVSVGALNRIDS